VARPECLKIGKMGAQRVGRQTFWLCQLGIGSPIPSFFTESLTAVVSTFGPCFVNVTIPGPSRGQL
jgi:hypothetical protein